MFEEAKKNVLCSQQADIYGLVFASFSQNNLAVIATDFWRRVERTCVRIALMTDPRVVTRAKHTRLFPLSRRYDD